MKKITKYVNEYGEEFDNATDCMTDDIMNATVGEIMETCHKNGTDCSTCPYSWQKTEDEIICAVMYFMCCSTKDMEVKTPNRWYLTNLEELD